MRDTLLAEEFEKLRTSKRKGTQQDDVGQLEGSASGTRRTRSQAAPEWTVHDSLILVNEIAAVEGECANALSTYQKWTIIAENCTALDVARTSNQCRRKWDSLLEEYKLIVEWEMRRKGNSYWSLDSGRRKKAGLPLAFTEDLFKAIDEVVKAQEERSGTDPDTDPEAEYDAFNSKEIGSKKPRRLSNHHKCITEEKDDKTENELPRRSAPHKATTPRASVENEPQRQSARCKRIKKEMEHVSTENQLQCQSTSCLGFTKEMEHVSPDNESQYQRTPQKSITEATEHMVIENELWHWSTSFKGSTHEEHAIDNDSQCQSIPYKGSNKENEHPSIGNESQNVSTPCMENSEEKKHVSIGNKSCYQLPPGEVIMEEMEHVLVQNEPEYQLTPNKQVSEEKEHVSTENGSHGAISGAEERKQLLIGKVRENTQLIHAIVAGNINQNADTMPADMKHEEAVEIKTARQKADKLIACIADLAKNLEFLNNVVEECQGLH